MKGLQCDPPWHAAECVACVARAARAIWACELLARSRHALRGTLVLVGLVVSGPGAAAMPEAQDMREAAEATAEHARRQGITLVWGSLWEATLRLRTPLVAAHAQGRCHLGYSAYTPGVDYRWLFPALPEAERRLWLQGLIHHELAHCADQARQPPGRPARPAAAAEGESAAGPLAWPQGQREREVLADLAFALHVAPPTAGEAETGARLVHLLAALRERHAAADPSHDSSVELRCYLRLRQSVVPEARPDAAPDAASKGAPDLAQDKAPWLDQLRAWQARCHEARPAAPLEPPPVIAASAQR